MRKQITVHISNTDHFLKQLIARSKTEQYFCLLNSNTNHLIDENIAESIAYDMLIAIGCMAQVSANALCVAAFDGFISRTNDWYFGHICFEAYNNAESLASSKPNMIHFPLLSFVQPQWVLSLRNNELTLHYPATTSKQLAHTYLQSLLNAPTHNENTHYQYVDIKVNLDESQYLEKIKILKQHITRGDIYEINYCLEFYARHANIDPYSVYLALNAYSPSPFSAFYKLHDKYLICSSPERYLKKKQRTLMSQPIKGTISRKLDKADDAIQTLSLTTDAKERAENVMITDLVRNDLSKIAEKGSVKVDELCKLYTFQHVHQLISTISAVVDPVKTIADIIFAAFPMGSMTGAPKHSALKLIETHETFKRGLFSGTIGYITPNNDFDFNVVIRSVLYNATEKYLSIPAGSAITAYCDATKEYHECLLKAEALIKTVSRTSIAP